MKLLRNPRSDGRIELVCPCGVGHPCLELMQLEGRKVEDWHGVHGCCGCCAKPAFVRAMQRLVKGLSK